MYLFYKKKIFYDFAYNRPPAIFNRELVWTVLRVYLLLGIFCQQVFQLHIWFKRVSKAHRGIPNHPKLSHSIPQYLKVPMATKLNWQQKFQRKQKFQWQQKFHRQQKF